MSKAEFLISAVRPDQFPDYGKKEAIVFGRSNVGKSTLINLLANAKIARTSSTPGHTKLLNFFAIDDFILVDAPGYGYTATGESFESLVLNYLEHRQELALILLLVDARHELKEADVRLLNLIKDFPYSVIGTKGDKLNQSGRTLFTNRMKKAGISDYHLININNRQTVLDLKVRLAQVLTN